MLLATAFFAYRVYTHVQTLVDPEAGQKRDDDVQPPVSFDTEALFRQAEEAYENDELKQAERLFRELSSKDPSNTDALNRYAFVLARNGDIESAISGYRTSLKVDPDNDIVHNALAQLLQEKRRYYEAQEHIKAALDIDDSYEVTYFNYGNLLIDMNDKEGAIMMFRKALEIKPD